MSDAASTRVLGPWERRLLDFIHKQAPGERVQLQDCVHNRHTATLLARRGLMHFDPVTMQVWKENVRARGEEPC